MFNMKKNDEPIRDITLSPTIIERAPLTGEAVDGNVSRESNKVTTNKSLMKEEINSVEGTETKKENVFFLETTRIPVYSSLPSLDIDKNDIHKDLLIRKILEKNISFKFEDQLYQFDPEDLENIINKLNDKRNKDLVLEGGYAKVLKYQKKRNTNNLSDTDFMIKIFNNFLLDDSVKGCNNGLEVKILKDLAKTYESYSPYLYDIILDYGDHEPKILVVVMECLDHDLNELIHFFMDTSDLKGFKDKGTDLKPKERLKNRLIKKKLAFYDTFYHRFVHRNKLFPWV